MLFYLVSTELCDTFCRKHKNYPSLGQSSCITLGLKELSQPLYFFTVITLQCLKSGFISEAFSITKSKKTNPCYSLWKDLTGTKEINFVHDQYLIYKIKKL